MAKYPNAVRGRITMSKLPELVRYWKHYFSHIGLTPAQAKLAFELHRKGSSVETAVYLAKQRA
jgi:hypothetical protein